MTKEELKSVHVGDTLMNGNKMIVVSKHLGDRIEYEEDTHEVNYEYLRNPFKGNKEGESVIPTIRERIEIKSRLPYVTNEKAKKLWEFLEDYIIEEDNNLYIPAFRVLDGLSMIDQEKIAYYGG